MDTFVRTCFSDALVLNSTGDNPVKSSNQGTILISDGTIPNTTNGDLYYIPYGGPPILLNGGDGPNVPVPDELMVYVSASGDDGTGTGTYEKPYLTIERALEDVRLYGWNESATIFIISTGGVFQWPVQLNVNVGSRGKQNTPLNIQGYSTNAVPGRTTVMTGAVVSSSIDEVNGLLTIQGGGIYTSDHVGQCLRFMTGPLTNYTFMDDMQSTNVDVFIADVPNSSSLTIAFSGAAPNIGDLFIIESIDTQIDITQYSTLTGADHILFTNLVFTAADRPSFVVESCTTCVFHAVKFVINTSIFIFTGYEGCCFTGGLNDFYNYNSNGIAPSTQSIMFTSIDSIITSLEGGPQYANVLLGNAVFKGNTHVDNVYFSGSIRSSYLDGLLVGAISNELIVSNCYFKGGIVTITKNSSATIRNTIFNYGITISNGSRCSMNTVTLREGSLEITLQSSCDVTNINFIDNNNINVLYNSKLLVVGDIDIMSNDIGLNVSGGSSACVTDTLSPHNCVNGIVVSEGSLLEATNINASYNINSMTVNKGGKVFANNITVNGNVHSGMNVDASYVTVGNNILSDGNQEHGLYLNNGSIVTVNNINASNSTLSGLYINTSKLFVNGGITTSVNNSGITAIKSDITAINFILRNGFVATGSNIIASGSLTFEGNGDSTTGVVFGENSTATLGNITITDVNAVGLTVNKSEMNCDKVSVHNCTDDNIYILNGSKVICNNIDSVNITDHESRGVYITSGSQLICDNIQILRCVTNKASLMIENDSSVVSTGTVSCTQNITSGIGSGVLIDNSRLSCGILTIDENDGTGAVVSNAGTLSIAVSGSVSNNKSGIIVYRLSQFINNGTVNINNSADGDGLLLEGRASAIAGILNGENNGRYGVSVHTGSRLTTNTMTNITGTLGEAVVGANAPTTWSNILTRNKQYTTDYLGAGLYPELCEIIMEKFKK